MTVPPEIQTERLRFRPWQDTDAPALLPVLQENVEHLAGWIPKRVAEPVPVAELGQRLAGFAADFEAGREWRYAILTGSEPESLVGEVALFPRNEAERVPYAAADRAEIGYWLAAAFTGRGFATEAARALLDVARTLPAMRRVEIRCDARNHPSAAVPRRLGFRLEEPVQDQHMIWYLDLVP